MIKVQTDTLGSKGAGARDVSKHTASNDAVNSGLPPSKGAF